MNTPQTSAADPFAVDENEPKVAKVVRPSELASSVKEWKLDSFAEPETQAKKNIETLSAEVLEKMQTAMQPQLLQQTELLKKEAYDEAFNKGYEEGLAKGLQEGKLQGEADAKSEVLKNLEPKLEDFEGLLTSLKKPYALLENKLYAEMVALAVHISETVLSREIKGDKQWILEAIQQAVVQLPESESDIHVYLNADDLAFIQISKPTISDKWVLHENPTLSPGCCIVKQDHSSVLNDWKLRFNDISTQILEESQVIEQPELDETND